MYLLYLDESGNPDGNEDRYFVLGGVALFERQVYWMNKKVDELSEQLFPGVTVEFHAQAINQHSAEPWKSIASDARRRTLEGLCKIITDERDVVLFAVALERSMTTEPVARAFEEICSRFDLFLTRLHYAGDTQRGLIIFDETRYETRLQKMLLEFRTGTRFGKSVKNFADVPFFADSKSTRMLQLADLVSYAVFRRYERSDTRWLDLLMSRFDKEGEHLHGLVHLNRERASCSCPACLTRRLSGGPLAQPPLEEPDPGIQ